MGTICFLSALQQELAGFLWSVPDSLQLLFFQINAVPMELMAVQAARGLSTAWPRAQHPLQEQRIKSDKAFCNYCSASGDVTTGTLCCSVTKDTVPLLLPQTEAHKVGTWRGLGKPRGFTFVRVWRTHLCPSREFHKSLTPPTLISGEGSAEFCLRTSWGNKERQFLLVRGGLPQKFTPGGAVTPRCTLLLPQELWLWERMSHTNLL